MANTTAPRGSRFNGLFYNAVNGRLALYQRGTLAAYVAGNDLVVSDDLSAADVTASGVLTGNSLAVVTGTVSIDEVAYTFPADNGDAGEQLQTDGAGVLTWEPSGV